MWPTTTNITTVTVPGLCKMVPPGAKHTSRSAYLHRDPAWSDSYPANSSSRDTFSSGGMVNTDWGRGSFFCFLDTTGLGEQITANQEEEKEDGLLLTFHIWPRPQREEKSAGVGEFSSLLWNFSLMGLVCFFPKKRRRPSRLNWFTWVWYLQSSWFVKVPHLFSFNCTGQRKISDDMFFMNVSVMCVNCIWTLTFFEEGDHFVNNILELPIWPAGGKKKHWLNTPVLRDFRI